MGRGLALSWPHLQERPCVRCVEGVQRLLQPPRLWAQGRAVLEPLDVLPQAPEKGSCGTGKGRSQAGPPRSPSRTLRLARPGAEAPQREMRSRGPSLRAGPAAMLPRRPCTAPGPSLVAPRLIAFHPELRFPLGRLPRARSGVRGSRRSGAGTPSPRLGARSFPPPSPGVPSPPPV